MLAVDSCIMLCILAMTAFILIRVFSCPIELDLKNKINRQPPLANPRQIARTQRTDLLRPSYYCGQTTLTSFPGRQPGADERGPLVRAKPCERQLGTELSRYSERTWLQSMDSSTYLGVSSAGRLSLPRRFFRRQAVLTLDFLP